MKNPDQTYTLFEDWRQRGVDDGPSAVHFGRYLGGGAREIVDIYDLKKRTYISTTSMDSELALVTANMALAAPGKIVYDPFVGTGSFIVACSHFGALTFGSDIDGRSIKGKGEGGVRANFLQYGLQGFLGDCFVADLTNTPLRKRRMLDAIIADPPYGVREGLKVLGTRDPVRSTTPYIAEGETIPRYL